MIVVRMELWPGGLRRATKEIGRIVIANDGTGTPSNRSYDVALGHAGAYSGRKGAWKGGRVSGYNGKQSPYHLLRMAVDAALRGTASAEATALIDCTRDGEQTPGERLLAKAIAKIEAEQAAKENR